MSLVYPHGDRGWGRASLASPTGMSAHRGAPNGAIFQLLLLAGAGAAVMLAVEARIRSAEKDDHPASRLFAHHRPASCSFEERKIPGFKEEGSNRATVDADVPRPGRQGARCAHADPGKPGRRRRCCAQKKDPAGTHQEEGRFHRATRIPAPPAAGCPPSWIWTLHCTSIWSPWTGRTVFDPRMVDLLQQHHDHLGRPRVPTARAPRTAQHPAVGV